MKALAALRTFGPFAAGWLFGLGFVGTFQAWFGLVTPHDLWMAESLTLAVGGNMLFGVAALPALALLSLLIRRSTAWTCGRGFAWGAAFALAPLAGGLMLDVERYRGNTTVGLWLLPVTALLAWKCSPRLLPKATSTAIGLAYCLMVWFWAGGRNLPPRYDVSVGPSYVSTAQTPADQRPPDVILVSLDTMRADAVFGLNRAHVPTLDALAARGLSAPYARSGSNCTVPGHIEMFSGLGPLQHGVLNNSGTTPSDIPLLGEQFAAAGYNTAAVVTNLMIEKQYGPSAGFMEWYDEPGSAHMHLRNLGDSTLIGWLTNSSQFALLVPLLFWGRPHAQNEWATQEADRSTRAARARIQSLSQSSQPYFLFAHFMDGHFPYRAPAKFFGTRDTAPGSSFGEYDQTRARYWEKVDYLDTKLNTLIETLNATERPYVLIVTGDHGEHLGEHDLVGHSSELFEPVVRVPFFLVGHGVPQGQLPPVSLSDVAPTLLACAGLPLPPEMTGMDVRDLVGKKSGEADQRILFARDERTVSAVIGSQKWAAEWPRGEAGPQPGIFRDIQADPGENNFIQDLPDLHDAILAHLRQAVDRSEEALSSERAAALRQMGYVDAAEGN